MILHKKSQKGFSLIELLLAIAIISLGLISVIGFASKSAERSRAEAGGEQLKEVAQALGNYISRESGILQACIATGAIIQLNTLDILTSATGTTTQGTCTLSNRSFLPDNTNIRNILGFEYRLLLKKTSSGSITGVVLSSAPITDPAYPAATIRYDWIGTAMQKAGASSGMTFTGAPTSMKGLGGGWELTSADFPTINQVGLLGYRVGYQGTYDDIYLRLDGAYPMRGNLNMGNYNINNATDINFNGWLNGNNALLNNLKTGYISNAGNIQTNTMTATTSVTTGGREVPDAVTNNTAMPIGATPIIAPGSGLTGLGWDLDYIHTGNIYAEGTIAAGRNQGIAASMNSEGLIVAKNIRLEPIRCDDTTSRGYSTLKSANCTLKDEHSGLLTDRLPQYVSQGAMLVTMPQVGEVADPTVVDLNADFAGVVPKPNCPAPSVAKIIVTPQIQNIYSQDSFNSVAPGNGLALILDTYTGRYSLRRPTHIAEQIQVYARDIQTSGNPNSNKWLVYITSANSQGTGSLIRGATGLAQTFCDYGVDVDAPTP